MINFDTYFHALTGHEAPMSWQRRLFERFAAGDLPRACDIPTGLGKTSVMAIWLAALDLRAGAAVRLPRRLVYVVDRRAVVDQATGEAEAFAGQLAHDRRPPEDQPEQRAVYDSLRGRLGLGQRENLAVSTLRGQLADNRRWLDNPASPAIVVGTVDMIGSRLLFSGYGVSPRQRPIHAALLGKDALILLDEAHLVPPFEALIRQVRGFVTDSSGLDGTARPLWLLSLSATQRGSAGKSATAPDEAGEVFSLTSEDLSDDTVRRRVAARKRLLIEPTVAAGELAETLAERAKQLSEGGRRVVVFCNARKVAQKIVRLLEKYVEGFLKDRKPAERHPEDYVAVLAGARRVLERQLLVDSPAFRRFAPKQGDPPPSDGMPSFLVATAAGEVGVDYDADHMVADLVPFERMVQRLGRVNRRGDFPGSLVDVFPVRWGKTDEPETGTADADIESWRAPFEFPGWPKGEDGRLDVSPAAFRALRNETGFAALAERASTPAPLRPALTRPHVEAWSMTSLDEHPGRALPAPFIRGWVDETPQTIVIWRTVLPIWAAKGDAPGDNFARLPKDVATFFEDAPPHLTEQLEVETYAVVELLQAGAKRLQKRPDGKGGEAVAVILDRDGNPERALAADDLRDLRGPRKDRLERELQGKTLVLRASFGGLDESGLLDPTSDQPVPSLDGQSAADAAVEQDEDEAADAEETAVAAGAKHDEVLEASRRSAQAWHEALLQEIGYRVRIGRERDEGSSADWRVAFSRVMRPGSEDEETARYWIVENYVGDRRASAEPAQARIEVSIADHLDHVAAWTGFLADRLGVPPPLREALTRAAALHDLGKLRRNWQGFAGRTGRPLDLAESLAKFISRANPALLLINGETYRHEFGSLVDVLDEADRHLAGLDPLQRELVLHLVASHHGLARPWIAAVDEKHLPERLAPHAARAALRFADMQAEFGPWRLAWLEAVLRAADVAASRSCAGPNGAGEGVV